VFLNITNLKVNFLLSKFFFFVFLSSPALAFAQELPEREVVVMVINDVYRIEGVERGQQGGMSLVRALRQQLEQQTPDLLFLHAGDFLFPSLLSEKTQGAHMVEMMNLLDGASGVYDSRMFVVFGNHEFEKSQRKHAPLLQARIDQSEFQWLGSNIRFSEEAGKPLVASDNLKVSRIVESGGVRVGIFGLTTDNKPASKIAYVDEFIDPLHVAREQSKRLREQGAEVVIALTHLAIKRDREILEQLGDKGPDLIVGGHEHQRHHVEINGRWILNGDADARTATVVRIRMMGKRPFISFGYRFLDRDRLAPDPEMQLRVNRVLQEHEEWFCLEHHEAAGCLQRAVGETAVPLIGEELEIRSYETNLGNWVADQVRAVAEDADIAFINTGSLRVNQDIPPGPITQRDLEELLPYNSELVQVELDNHQLDAVLERATEDWSGKGYWLQISGFAFTHDPRKAEGRRVDAISLVQNGKLMTLPDRPLQAITYKFLVEGGDGYDMLKPLKWVSVGVSLKERLRQILRASTKPIQPHVDGRICNLAEVGRRPCAFKDIPNQ
jgi:2',3'-cyclic-nucleotide 2'-phosphodiesterase (5'-nucleotidase family)